MGRKKGSELLQEVLRHLQPLRQEVKSKKGGKILDFLEELLDQTCGKAEELENTLAAALQSAQQCRESVKKSGHDAGWYLIAWTICRSYKPTKLQYQNAGDGVFVITLNDPKRLNCMSLNLVQEVTWLSTVIVEICDGMDLMAKEHVKRDERCKIIVWTGAGRAFSAGGNFTDTSTTVPEEVFEGYIQEGLAVQPPDVSLAGTTRATWQRFLH
eukprot:s689_g55.t1